MQKTNMLSLENKFIFLYSYRQDNKQKILNTPETPCIHPLPPKSLFWMLC